MNKSKYKTDNYLSSHYVGKLCLSRTNNYYVLIIQGQLTTPNNVTYWIWSKVNMITGKVSQHTHGGYGWESYAVHYEQQQRTIIFK